MPKSVRQVLTQYVKEDRDVQYRLHLLMHVFKKFSNGMKEIVRMFGRKLDPIRFFKMLILIHKCYLEQVFQAEVVLNLLYSIKPPTKTLNQLHKILCNKVLPQYTLYLQKCYHLKLTDTQSYKPTPTQQVYMKINLITRALDFAEIIYTFGRYYNKQYTFIAEYNAIVGIDVRKIYYQLSQILKCNCEIIDEEMNLEIENMHERMYIIYYNCYFYKKCMKYQPEIWINTTYVPNIVSTPRGKNSSFDTKSRKKDSLEHLISTIKSTNYETSTKKQIDTHHKSILSNEEIENILRLCREDNNKQVSQFKIYAEETVIAEYPFDDQVQQEEPADQISYQNRKVVRERLNFSQFIGQSKLLPAI